MYQSDGDVKFHQRHIQTVPVEQLYAEFLNLTEYNDWRVEHAYVNSRGEQVLPSIGLRLFQESKCRCIQWQGQEDCADHLLVGFEYKLKALALFRKKIIRENDMNNIPSCSCEIHNLDGYDKIHHSIKEMMNFCMSGECMQKEYPTLSLEDVEAKS